ncbi:UDP-glucose/GDP-mannose dehydrogenase family protein [Candidatus Kaiserbacteria bacterium]|nr:UDP-glucose/GDP-mannose dehydrogenase family protein [Candidatus Kaiserbacteria bacterium]
MPRIGFIGQGYVGKSHADDFARRGYAVVRYAKEAPYAGNQRAITGCHVVFIAVPTPTTPAGVDLSIVESVIPLARAGATVVIKSTLPPGTTEKLAKRFPDRFILHAPEFLRETRAAEDAARPERVIIGIPRDTSEYRARAEAVRSMLPRAPFTRIVPARAAELVKYAGNVFLYLKVVYANLLYDLARATGVAHEDLSTMLAADPRIGPSHLTVIHASGHTNQKGRGAGGHCFIKDFEAFRRLYGASVSDSEGCLLLEALKNKNNDLLRESGKDLDLLAEVYGPLP